MGEKFLVAVQQAEQGGLAWWVWLLIAVLLVLLVLWFFSIRREKIEVSEENLIAIEEDLTMIEGIGPKISELLKAAGIKTYRGLAAADPRQLSAILSEADFRAPADPATWPEQARLAAIGDWTGLKDLQDQLQGGRREEQ